MIDKLYEKTIERKSEINNYFESIPEMIDKELVKKKYHEYNFDTTEQDKTFAAIDGSFNSKNYMASIVYALSSQTIVSRPSQGITKQSQGGDIYHVPLSERGNIRKILSNRMSILELKSTIDTLKRNPDIDYMLIDGNISGKITNLDIPIITDIIERILISKINIKDKILNLLDEEDMIIENTTLAIKEDLLYDISMISGIPLSDIEKEEQDIISFVEIIEQLCCVYYLIENFGDKIIGVSKTSSTTNIFDDKLSDATILEYANVNPGTTDVYINDNPKLVRKTRAGLVTLNYPVLNNELSRYQFTTAFTKLDDIGNILKIELPYRATKEDMIDILNNFKSISIEGYPYILKKAHDEVVITDIDMGNIVRKLEIYEKTGRDML
ncbi:MAG: DNA double-strand break repair nuclease NurA [Methanosphaera sp.]|nr:DNA double-strand break repair nuclease NurA [Methanosphaera sp.]